MKTVVIYTDGGCHGNPGPGGWAAVLRYAGALKEISGNVAATTNNRMELTAAISALSTLKEPCNVQVSTDSKYVLEGVTQWLPGWKARGWRTATKKAVKNADLWRALDALNQKHSVEWIWVKGHASSVDNNRCDLLVQVEIEKIKKALSPAQLKAALGELESTLIREASSGELFA